MRTRTLISFCLVPLITSCDKASKIASEASAAVREKVAEVSAGEDSEEKIDPELAKLVDRTDEGVVFRKDLPFPKQVEVTSTTTMNLQLRVTAMSELERRAAPLNGLMTVREKLARSGDSIRHQRVEMGLTDPTAKDAEGKAKVIMDNPLARSGAEVQRVFHKRNGVWKPEEGSGFVVTAQAKDVAPVLETLLQENGLAVRPQWFAKQRIPVGHEVVLSGETLPVLIGGKAKGSIKMKLESIGSVAGHPCGVFSVSGDFSRDRFPAFDGVFTDEDVTIESGKVWLSLLYPLVLKWDFDTIQTFKIGSKGGPSTSAQGAVGVSVEREWKATP